MTKKIHNKLVRDGIPRYLSHRNISPITRILDKAEYEVELRKKLREEVEEYFAAQNTQDRRMERADILEVLNALALLEDGDIEQVEVCRKAKLQERGGFENRIFLIETNE
jgi:predicted house-cleaning noncanonical NTP pyrophosphatase (MazG superfamily)